MRLLAITALLPLLVVATPTLAATKAQKMETCKFGADNEKLEGAKRDAFIKKCMANGNYEPAARREAMKKKPMAKKKTVAKKKTMAKPTAPTAAPPADTQKQ